MAVRPQQINRVNCFKGCLYCCNKVRGNGEGRAKGEKRTLVMGDIYCLEKRFYRALELGKEVGCQGPSTVPQHGKPFRHEWWRWRRNLFSSSHSQTCPRPPVYIAHSTQPATVATCPANLTRRAPLGRFVSQKNFHCLTVISPVPGLGIPRR